MYRIAPPNTRFAGKQFSKDVKRFLEGSVIVKEKIGNRSEGRKPLLYTLMKKRERGYNPMVGDWEFLVVAGNGTQLEASGKILNCQACHLGRSDSDFVFRPLPVKVILAADSRLTTQAYCRPRGVK
jgi:Cytochrome P460